MTTKLLITARDAAAGLHLAQVALASQQDLRYNVTIAAQQPAASHFAAAGLPVQIVPPLSANCADCPQADELRGVARQLLIEHRPDVVLVGLSTPFDAGLDEAILAEAKVPRILFQDFWGEQNLLLGTPADLILTVDEEAANLNAQRFGARSVVVGSVRHVAYANIDIGVIRRDVRTGWGLGDEAKVVGFFGQALHRLPGYKRTIKTFIEALGTIAEPFHLIVRPHPREDAEQKAETERLFHQAGIRAIVDTAGSVENALIGCDVVCSLFSSCTYDAAYLNRFSTVPVAVPISMLFDEEIASYCRQHVNFETFPYHRAGVVLSVHESWDLAGTLSQSLTQACLERIWRNAHDYLPDPCESPRLTLDTINDFLKVWSEVKQ